MIRLVTDSSSQIPHELVERYGVTVVPIEVTVDGVSYREGVDLDADGFYALWRDGPPEVSTSQPSPGDFAATYDRLAAEGAGEILSIHVGSEYSGTVNSARLAAASSPVPVHIVDTATMSFGVTCCVWEAAAALAAGATVGAAVAAAEAIVPRIGSVTVLQALEFTRAQGRLVDALPDQVDGIPVLAIEAGETTVLGEGRRIDELAALMVDHMTRADHPIRVAICVADATATPFVEAMDQLLVDRETVVDLVRYRVGPSIGAFTGPGAAGGFYWPA